MVDFTLIFRLKLMCVLIKSCHIRHLQMEKKNEEN